MLLGFMDRKEMSVNMCFLSAALSHISITSEDITQMSYRVF